jgi:hypothetical protein
MPSESPDSNLEEKTAAFSDDKNDRKIVRRQTRRERIQEFLTVLSANPAIRITLLICGVIVPFISFFMSGMGTHWGGEPWQSGNLSTYIGLLIAWPVSASFFPVLGYSIFCLVTWVFNPALSAKKYWVRLGVYFGVLWSIAFTLVAYVDGSSLFFGTIVMSAIMYFIASVGFSIVWSISWLMVKGYQNHWWLFVSSCVVGLFILFSGSFVLGMFGPPLAFISYSIAAASIWSAKERSFQFTIAKLLGTTVYLASVFATWRLAIDLMLIEYSKLPTEDPNCFVSAAAAKGHRRWVGSDSIAVDGKIVCVNRQMRELKAGEFVLKAVAPGFHRILRRCYNGVGPRLAKMICRSKSAADIAYISLVPIQLLVITTLKLFRIDTQKIKNLYQG